MGALTYGGQYVGDAPFRTLGQGGFGDHGTIFDRAAMDRVRVTEAQARDALDYAARRYRHRLMMTAARRYKSDRSLLNKILWGLASRPTAYIAAVIDHELEFTCSTDVRLLGARVYARYLRRLDARMDDAEHREVA